MRKKEKILTIFILLFSASCSAAGGNNMNNPAIDGVPFDYLYAFESNGDDYQVLFPSNNDESSYYLYYETEYTTEMSSWIVNYYYDSIYYVDEGFNINDDLLLDFFSSLMDNKAIIENLLGYSIELKNPTEKSIEEVLINNPFNEKINCVVVDKYIPLRLKNVSEYSSYTISVPIERIYLAKCEGRIESPIDKQIISWEDFLAIPKLYKRKD